MILGPRLHLWLGAVCWVLLAVQLPSAALPSPAEPYAITDFADFASTASCAAHALRLQKATPRSTRATVGTRFVSVTGVAIEPGGAAGFVLSHRNRGVAGVSCVQLTFATAPPDYGKLQRFSIVADGREAAEISERDPGGGVFRSYFVELPGAGPSWRLKVVSDHASACPVTLSAARLYRREEGSPWPLGKLSDGREKTALALLSAKGGGYSIDEEEMRRLRRLLPASPLIVPQTAVLYNYSVRTAEQHRSEIGRLAGLAEKTNIPLRIAFQTHWAGLPQGVPDGAGGTFTDLPYQQITFDSEETLADPDLDSLMGDRADARFGRSVPNVWSNTPWLTMNHPRLNQLRRIRLTQAIRVWGEERDRLAAAGKSRLLPLENSTGDETVYWAKGVEDSKFTTMNGGKPRSNLMADFNPYVALDAALDRVALDPRDGLDGTERWWLHQNLGRQQQRLVDWMFDALPPEPIRIADGAAAFAPDLARRNLFTEPYGMPLFPLKERNSYHPGIELGSVANGRPGAEYWSGAEIAPWLAKQREFGRSALPNLESTGANDAQFVACLQAAYAYGVRYMTIYNWQHRPNTPALLREFVNSATTPPLLEWPAASPAFASREGADGPAKRTFVAGAGTFGFNRIEIQIAGSSSLTSLRVTISIGAAADRSFRVTVPADVQGWQYLPNADPNRPVRMSKAVTRPIGGAPEMGDARWISVPLPGMLPIKPGETGQTSVEILGPGRVALAADGRPAMRLVTDLQAERARSLAIQDWKDAADLIESVGLLQRVQPHGKQAGYALAEAKMLLAGNQPRAAYRRAIQAEQLTLPAAYELAAPGGRLHPYWVRLRFATGKLRAVIRSYTDDAVTVEIRSDAAQQVDLDWAGRTIRANLAPRVSAELSIDRRSLPGTPQRPGEPPVRIVPGGG